MTTAPAFVETPDGARLAYHRTPGETPTVVFLGGFASDMTGAKAVYLESWCRTRGRGFLRLDYQGHGASSGRFDEGTIGQWAADAEAVVRAVVGDGPLVLVGSSMGGWMMLIVARRLGARVAGLVGVAPAPDFTEDLMRARLAPEHQRALTRDGRVTLPSEYDPDGYVVTGRLLDEAREHLQLRAPIPLRCPVRLVHGMADPDVPWQVSLRLAEQLESSDVRLSLLKGAGHRLSEPHELETIAAALDDVIETASRR